MNYLHTEVLTLIFKQVQVTDLIACRKVCLKWKEIVVSLDSVWENACKQDFSDVYDNGEAYGRARLSWAEFYTSLSLWPDVGNAEIRAQTLARSSLGFQIIEDGLIAVPHESSFNEIGSKTVVYYDIETLEEKYREDYEFNFIAFKENEYVTVLIDVDERLCITSRYNPKLFFFDDQKICQNTGDRFELNQNEVYVFHGTNGTTIYIYKVEENENDVSVSVKTVILECDVHNVVSIVNFVNDVYILVNSYEFDLKTLIIHRYSFLEKCFKSPILLNGYHREPFNLYAALGHYRFNYDSSALLNCMIGATYEGNEDVIKESKLTAVYSLGFTYVAGTADCMLHVYHKPYYGLLDLDTEQPIKSFDLNVLCNTTVKRVTQVDVVEIENGHKVIVLLGEQIFVIEFLHVL